MTTASTPVSLKRNIVEAESSFQKMKDVSERLVDSPEIKLSTDRIVPCTCYDVLWCESKQHGERGWVFFTFMF